MSPESKIALRYAFGVYLAWVVATYLLEGMVGTLLRPEAAGLRLAYALVANLAIGVFLALWVIRNLVRRQWAAASDFGFSSGARVAGSVVAAATIGYALFALSQPERMHPVVVLNAYAQVWVVSVAEIIVCWGLVGATLYVALRDWSRWGAYLVASAVASVLFGVYHFARSAPFNEPRMVLFLAGIGFVTSLWWFASRDVYGTAIFHTFFGVTGVLAALKAGGLVPGQPAPEMPLIVAAALVALAVVVPGILWLRRAARSPAQDGLRYTSRR